MDGNDWSITSGVDNTILKQRYWWRTAEMVQIGHGKAE